VSVQKRSWQSGGKTKTAWRVKWEDGAGWQSKTFDRKADADTFNAEVTRRRRLGTLAMLDAGTETLGDYVADTWSPTYGPLLSPKTKKTYATLYRTHLEATFSHVRLRDITPELVSRWQSDRLASGAGPASVRKTLDLLGNILQRAVEGQRIVANPVRIVRKAKVSKRPETRPLVPVTIEAMRTASGERDKILLSLLAYAGLRPGEALGLQWGDVRDRTLIIERAVSLGEVKATKTGQHRTVRLLEPLARDLAEWRMRCGRPADTSPVIPANRGGVWSETEYRNWRRRSFAKALKAAGVDSARPYDLRHSFASLLLHEGRSVIYVARQLGHDARLTLSVYGHVMDELEGTPNVDAEAVIREARSGSAGHRLAIATG
jgi:integrase